MAGKNIEAILDHNITYITSENEGGMIYLVRKKINEKKIENYSGKPAVTAEFFCDHNNGMIINFGDEGVDDIQHLREHYVSASYILGYNLKNIGEILFLICGAKATDDAKEAIGLTSERFNSLYANRFPHESNLLLREPTATDEKKPFSKSEAARNINDTLRKHRAQTAR